MLEVLSDPEHAALVGWLVSTALVVIGLIGGLLGWMEIRNSREHRDLGHRIDKANDRIDNSLNSMTPIVRINDSDKLVERLLHARSELNR